MNIMANQFEVERFKTIDANGHIIVYDSWGAGWRYETLLDKEPETIEWIDTFEPGESFWDVGANIGIYSVYAAARGVKTLAFEPHFANYHQLCLSIALNGQQDVVTPLCLAFAQSKAVGQINLASIDVGTSMSNFGEALDFRGRPFDAAFRQGMIGYDIDSFIADFGLDVPTHLKIDVDGIELPIVEGARRTLADPRLQSVAVELIETDEAQVAAVTELMEAAGLHFVHKKQNMAFATSDTTDVKNFLFHRDPARYQRLVDERIAKFVADYHARCAAETEAEAEAEEDAPVTTDQLIDQIVARIAAAPIDGEPSPNLYMADMLPPAVYQELLARLPDDSALDPINHPDAIGPDGKATRLLLDLTQESLARINPDDQPFWEAMIEVFTAPAIAGTIIAKFAPSLHARFGTEVPELVAVPVLYRDLPGYRIGIHPDTPSKIATLQFYLPGDDSQRHLGTSFHKRTAAGFQKLKTNDFRPNSAYAFVRTDESWHSVDQLGPDEAPRNTIALTFYIKGKEYRSAPKAAPVIKSDFYDADLSAALKMLAGTFGKREDVASLFREGGLGVELGGISGDLSARLLEHGKMAYLYSINEWPGDRSHDIIQYREAIARLAPHRDRNAILRMRFDEALSLFDDHSLDFVYLDGQTHNGETTSQTLRDWFPKLKAGGIIVGEDYHAAYPYVVTAVDHFIGMNGLELHVADCSDTSTPIVSTWFAMRP